MIATIMNALAALVITFIVVAGLGAMRQYVTKTNKAASLTIGFAGLFGDDRARVSPLADDAPSSDDDAVADDAVDVTKTNPVPMPNLSRSITPIIISLPTALAPPPPPPPPPISVMVPTTPDPMVIASATSASSSILLPSISSPMTPLPSPTVFQSLVLLCSRSGRLPPDALHDVVRTELISSTIQPFESDILHSLIANSSATRASPRRHQSPDRGSESPSRKDLTVESPVKQFGEDGEMARTRASSTASIYFDNDDRDATSMGKSDSFDTARPALAVTSWAPLQDCLRRLTEWNPESDHQWEMMLNEARDARFAALRRACNEEGVSPEDGAYCDVLRPAIEAINAEVLSRR